MSVASDTDVQLDRVVSQGVERGKEHGLDFVRRARRMINAAGKNVDAIQLPLRSLLATCYVPFSTLHPSMPRVEEDRHRELKAAYRAAYDSHYAQPILALEQYQFLRPDLEALQNK